jgi:hypothetical protein
MKPFKLPSPSAQVSRLCSLFPHLIPENILKKVDGMPPQGLLILPHHASINHHYNYACYYAMQALSWLLQHHYNAKLYMDLAQDSHLKRMRPISPESGPYRHDFTAIRLQIDEGWVEAKTLGLFEGMMLCIASPELILEKDPPLILNFDGSVVDVDDDPHVAFVHPHESMPRIGLRRPLGGDLHVSVKATRSALVGV